MFQKTYHCFIFVFLLINLDSCKSIGSKEAIKILANQTLTAFEHLLTKCEYVPKEIKPGGK